MVEVVEDVEAGTLAGAIIGVQAMVSAERLLALDDLWTSALADLDPDDPAGIASQVEAYRQLVQDLDGALLEFSDQAKDLEKVLNSATDDEVNTALDKALEQDPAGGEAREEVFRQEITEVGPRGAAIFACQFISEETSRERNILWEKYERLESGEVPDPDLRPIYRCALYLARIGGAAAAIIGTQGLALALHISSAVRIALMGWRKSLCKETWAELTRDRL